MKRCHICNNYDLFSKVVQKVTGRPSCYCTITAKDKKVLVDNVEEYIKIQSESGTKDSYGQGLLNGLVLAISAIDGRTPLFFNKKFERDMPRNKRFY